ncbi:MAG: FecR domain-containing protein [Spirochaetes bacterium]|nr:FecR domain-containing protein [Spirochaetota bacterium]
MKLSRRDKTVAVILLLIIALLVYVLQCHWSNRFGVRGDAKPVGEVTYKYHQVQRKLSDRMLWEDVESKAPVYAYDWVMTKDKSDARITLKGGMKVDLDPETMVEIDETRDGVGLTLRDGSIRADTRDSKSGTISAPDGTKIDLNAADAQIRADGKNLTVDVKEGKATLKNGNNESQVAAGEIGQANATGFTKEKTLIKLKAPEQGVILEDAEQAVNFGIDAPTDSKDCSLELANGRNRREIKIEKGMRNERLEDGTYQWRASCIDKGQKIYSPVGTFRVRPATAFALIAPQSGEVVPANKAENLALRWRSKTPTKAELAADANFSKILKTSDGKSQELSAQNLKPGTYYWRVIPKDDKNRALQSSFVVSDKGELLTENNSTVGEAQAQTQATHGTPAKPKTDALRAQRITARAPANVVIEPDAATGRVKVSWNPVSKKDIYRVRVARDREFSERVATQEVKGQGSLTIKLKPGEYYYRVDVRQPRAKRATAATLPQKLNVARKKLPPPPRVKSVQAE